MTTEVAPARSALGPFLKGGRKAAALSLADVAAQAGCTPAYLSQVERGLRTPTELLTAKLCGLYGVRYADARDLRDLGLSLVVVRLTPHHSADVRRAVAALARAVAKESLTDDDAVRIRDILARSRRGTK